MANSPQARKRARQNDRRRVHNHSARSMMRTHIKRVQKAIEANDATTAQSAYREAVSVIDKNVKRGLQNGNSAARIKSRLNARIRAIA